MHKRIFTLLLLVATLPAWAGVPEGKPIHEVRLGWGDMLFETLAFHPGTILDKPYKNDFGYTGHIFGEYQHRLNKTLSVGAQLDFEGIFWKEDGVPVRNYNLVVLPSLRFIYFERPWVTFYSGVGAGLLVAFDNARRVELAPALNLNLFSVKVGNGPWSGTLEIGALNAFKNAATVYMVASRIFSVSINYAW